MIARDVPVSDEIKAWAEVLAHRLELDLDTDADLTKHIRYEVVFGRCIRILIVDRILDILPVYKDAQGVWQIHRGERVNTLTQQVLGGAPKKWII